MNDIISQSFMDPWLGELSLRFSLCKGKSVLTECKHSGPFCVQNSFYPEENKMSPHVYLLHPAGGLVGGDQLILNVQLEANSNALLTTSGASKFYKTNGLYALQKNTFKLSNNSVLEWVPQSNIFFPKSKATIDSTFIVHSGASVISFEMLCFRNVILNVESVPEEINVLLNIYLSDSIGLQERLQVNAADYAIKLGGFKIGAVFFAIPSNEKILCQVRKLIKEKFVDNFQIGGVTLLKELLVVRLLGNDNQSLKNLLCHIWNIVRLDIIGKEVIVPRIWFT